MIDWRALLAGTAVAFGFTTLAILLSVEFGSVVYDPFFGDDLSWWIFFMGFLSLPGPFCAGYLHNSTSGGGAAYGILANTLGIFVPLLPISALLLWLSSGWALFVVAPALPIVWVSLTFSGAVGGALGAMSRER